MKRFWRATDWPPRDPRVDVDFDVRVHCDAGEIEAQIVNLSSDGFRLHSANPLEVGWEVTLEARQAISGEGADLLGLRPRMPAACSSEPVAL